MVVLASAGAGAREAKVLEVQEEGGGREWAFVVGTGPGEVGVVEVGGFGGGVRVAGAGVQQEGGQGVLLLASGGEGVADAGGVIETVAQIDAAALDGPGQDRRGDGWEVCEQAGTELFDKRVD